MRTIYLTVLVLVSVFVIALLTATAAEQPKITLYFLTHSGACPCQADACKTAKPIAGFIQTHLAAGVDYKELDYGTRPDAVEPLQQQYKLFTFPAVLAIDANKGELVKIQGRLNRDEVLKKLFDQGLITGVN